MQNYDEVEKLFKSILEEKDKFSISKKAALASELLKELIKTEKIQGLEKEQIENLENLLDIYSIIYNEYMRSEVEKQMKLILACLDLEKK